MHPFLVWHAQINKAGRVERRGSLGHCFLKAHRIHAFRQVVDEGLEYAMHECTSIATNRTRAVDQRGVKILVGVQS